MNVFVRYLKSVGSNSVGTVVDTLVLWLLSDYAFDEGWWGEYVVSPVLSFQSAVLVNFTISYFYVWKDRIPPTGGMRTFLRLYAAYNLSCTTVFLLRMGILLLIERFSGWDVVLCNLTAMCVTGLVNFLLSDNVIFRKR